MFQGFDNQYLNLKYIIKTEIHFQMRKFMNFVNSLNQIYKFS